MVTSTTEWDYGSILRPNEPESVEQERQNESSQSPGLGKKGFQECSLRVRFRARPFFDCRRHQLAHLGNLVRQGAGLVHIVRVLWHLLHRGNQHRPSAPK